MVDITGDAFRKLTPAQQTAERAKVSAQTPQPKPTLGREAVKKVRDQRPDGPISPNLVTTAAGAPTAPDPNRALRTVSFFDPKKRKFTGIAAPAGAPKNAMEVANLRDAADIVNAEVKVTPTVPTRGAEGGAPVPAPEPEPPKAATPEDDIAEINTQAQSRIDAIKAEPTLLAVQQQEIAQVEAQAKAEVDAIKFEEAQKKKAKEKLGKDFAQDKLEEKISEVTEIASTQNVSLAVAEGMWNRQNTERANLDPEAKESYDRIISRYSEPDFDQEDAYNVAIAEYEKDGIEIEDRQKAYDAVASRFGKNAATKMQDDYLKDVLGMDASIVDGNTALTRANELGTSIAAGKGGSKDTDIYLSTIEGIGEEYVHGAIMSILNSPTSTSDAKEQAFAYGEDFYGKLTTDEDPVEPETIAQLEARFLTEGFDTAEDASNFLTRKSQLAAAGRAPTSSTAVGVGSQFENLTTADSIAAKSLAVSIYGKRAGLKPENINEILTLRNEGMSIDDIGDLLRTSETSEEFQNVFRDAYETVSSGFTSERASRNRDSLDRLIQEGRGAEAKDLLLKLARDSADSTTRQLVDGREDAIFALDSIQDALNSYIEKGGETDIFEGTIQSIKEKVGAVGDPELAGIANEIQIAIQAYRKSVSGAAFTESEATEYKGIFPSTGNVPELNKAKIDSLLEIFGRNQSNFYSRQMGRENYESVFNKQGRDNTAPQTNEQEFGQALTQESFDTALTDLQGIFPDREITDDEILDYLNKESKTTANVGPETAQGGIRPKEDVAQVAPLTQEEATSSATEFIAKEEGFREQAYQDSAGVWTIGFGTTSRGGVPVKEGDTINEGEAQKEVDGEIGRLEAKVDQEFGNSINEFQKVALTSFMYNLGLNIFDKPEAQKLKTAIKEGDIDTIRDQWVQYINAGGNPIAGLQNRRERELAQFLTAIA